MLWENGKVANKDIWLFEPGDCAYLHRFEDARGCGRRSYPHLNFACLCRRGVLSSVAASLVWAKSAELDIEVDLPEDFDPPFDDDVPVHGEQLDPAIAEDLERQLFAPESANGHDTQKDVTENIKRR